MDRYTQSEFVSLSGMVNSIIDRYTWICKQHLPDLNNAEWGILLNVYAGSEMSSYYPPYRIASDIMDDMGADDLAQVADIHPERAEFIRKVHKMNQAEQLAILDFCQRYWCGDWDGYESFDEIKKALTE